MDTYQAALAAAYAHGPGKSIRLSEDSPSPAPPGRSGAIDLSRLAESGDFGAALARTLAAALAPRRWEPWNSANDHRAYPSPRSAWLTGVTLLLDGERWMLDPVRLHLVGGRTVPSTITTASVQLRISPDRLPEGYGTLRDALGLLEAGHVSSALVEAGSAAGLAACGVSRVTEQDIVDEAYGVVAEVTLRPGPRPTWPWQRVIAERSAGLSPRGLSADPRPLPGDVLRTLLADGHASPAGSLARPASASVLRHRLAIHAVTGFQDGLYELHDGQVALRQPGPATRWLQSAFRYGPEDVDVAGMNVVWVVTADVAAAVRAHGPVGYPQVLLAAGAAAQHVCSAAALAGLFCRPVRSFEEPATEAAVRADPGEDVVYMLLIGRPWALDFCYDLTHPEDSPWP